MTIRSLGDAALDQAINDSSMLERLREEAPVGPFGLIARADMDIDRIDQVLRSFGYYDALIEIRIAGLALNDSALLPTLEQLARDAEDQAPLQAQGRTPLQAPTPAPPQAQAKVQHQAGATPPQAQLQIQVQIDQGPLYRLGRVQLDGQVPPAARAAFNLQTGEPASAPEVLAAGTAVLAALREDGFPFAQVPPPEAIVDHRTRTMAVSYRAEPGERLSLGEIEIIGLERLREGYVRRRLGLKAGDAFSPSRLEAARRALMRSEALASARLTTGTAPDASGRLPLRLEVVERPRRVLRLAGAYSSDEGGSLSTAWTHRNLFGGAEQLTLAAEVSQLSAGPIGDINDSASAALRIPDLWRRDLDLQLKLGAVSERLEAYDRDALTASALLEQRVSSRLRIGAGLGVERARIVQDGPAEDFELLSLPMTLDWDGSDDPLDPRRGWRLTAQLTPTPMVQGDGDPFVRVRMVAATYLDLSSASAAGYSLAGTRLAGPRQSGSRRPGRWPSGPTLSGRTSSRSDAIEPEVQTAADPPLLGRRVLAARLAIGRTLGANASAIPPDWRFYAGGGGSVRGYPFQSIGPRTANGSPAGGDALLEGSLELRQRIGERWGLATFVDVGDVSADGFRGFGNLAIGVGLGARFHTPVGPIRIDLATPLTVAEDDPPVQLYIGIGQAF